MAYFENVKNIQFEGANSTNPLAFKYYNPQEVINGKTMEELLRFSVTWWHTFTADGTDPFDAPTTIVDMGCVYDFSDKFGLRISGGPDAYQVEVGLDLRPLLETIGGESGDAGSDVALVRFFANARAVVAFCAALLEEFGRFPTDPTRVSPGEAG